MRGLTIGLLCAALLMSGCTRQQVNSYSVFEYEAGDNAFLVMLKTTGNLVPWVGGAVVLAVMAAPQAALQGGLQAAADASRK
jgi:hypothetical protein